MRRTRSTRVRCLLLPGAQDDAGNAVLEFLFLAVLLVFVAADSVALGQARAAAATAIVLRDSGLTAQPGGLDLTCSARPCLTPGAKVTVVLTYAVDLPLAPPLLTDAVSKVGATIAVTGRHVEVVDRFRAIRP